MNAKISCIEGALSLACASCRSRFSTSTSPHGAGWQAGLEAESAPLRPYRNTRNTAPTVAHRRPRYFHACSVGPTFVLTINRLNSHLVGFPWAYHISLRHLLRSLYPDCRSCQRNWLPRLRRYRRSKKSCFIAPHGVYRAESSPLRQDVEGHQPLSRTILLGMTLGRLL